MKGLSSYPNPALRHLRMPPGVPSPSLYYRFMRMGCRVLLTPFSKVRVFDRHREPAEGGAVYICNHQSFLDPILMCFALRRSMNFMARHTLFRIPGFRHLIASLNTFPVRRGTADTGAIKEAMRRLKAGEQVVIFAEGTRTLDGRIRPFLPGVALLARRAAKWTVPVLIDGAFESWPRTQALPSPGNIVVRYAEPIHQDDARKEKPADFVEGVRQTIIEMQTDTRRRLGRPPLTYDG